MNEFKNSAEIVPGSRGIILSDYNGTLNLLKDGTAFCRDLFVSLAAWKNSGYDVILHTMSPGDAIDMNIDFEGMKIGLNKGFFNPRLDFDFNHDLVIGKSETDHLDILAMFDDEVFNREGQTGAILDVNLPHVRAALKRTADEYEASGRTKIMTFNPQDFIPMGGLGNKAEPVLAHV